MILFCVVLTQLFVPFLDVEVHSGALCDEKGDYIDH